MVDGRARKEQSKYDLSDTTREWTASRALLLVSFVLCNALLHFELTRFERIIVRVGVVRSTAVTTSPTREGGKVRSRVNDDRLALRMR